MPGPKKPTIRQVARVAGVSPTTVSFVLNGRPSDLDRISEDTRQRVLSVVEQLGYFPDQSARNLRRRNTNRICLAVNELGIPHNSILAKELYEIASQLGYMTIIAMLGSLENEKKVLEQLMSGFADGAIFLGLSYLSNDDLARLAQIGCAVSVSSNHLDPPGVDVVRSTEKEASLSALQYLYDKGHRRIAYLGRLSTPSSPFDRHEAYLQFLAGKGLAVKEGYLRFDPGVSREEAYQTAGEMLSLPEPPTAIFCGSDLAAISTLYLTKHKGIRVPDEVAVIGSGNLPEGKLWQPALTTVGPEQLNFNALLQFLFTRLNGEAPPEGRLHEIPWNLIIRESA